MEGEMHRTRPGGLNGGEMYRTRAGSGVLLLLVFPAHFHGTNEPHSHTGVDQTKPNLERT